MKIFPLKNTPFVRFHLERSVRQALLQAFTMGHIASPYLYFDIDFWNPALIHSIAQLEQYRIDNSLISKNYVLALRKYYKRYNKLPIFFKIEYYDTELFKDFLLQSLISASALYDKEIITTAFEPFTWENMKDYRIKEGFT